jgi:outer membrane lipoprotein carrier protein
VKRLLSLLGCVSALALAVPGHAESIERLKNFIRETHSARAEFSQTVLDKDAQPKERSSGTMQFSRPGKFRWEYLKPSRQLIVGDGEKLWLWDPDLNQATVKKMHAALGSSPAALLAGSDAIEQSFALKDGGKKDSLEWVEATSKDPDSTFESIRMGFSGNSLAAMELKDNFGQTTLLRFAKLEKNPRLAPDVFTFAPPAGADVIGE